jgi:hypothetical protein
MNPICPICNKAIYSQDYVTLHSDCNNKRVTLDPTSAESMRAYHQNYLSELSLSELLWFMDTTWSLIKEKSVKVELPA